MTRREELVQDGLLSVKEAIQFSGVKMTLLYALMGRGELPFVKIGDRRLIPRRALVELAAKSLRGKIEE